VIQIIYFIQADRKLNHMREIERNKTEGKKAEAKMQ
jgi:hypothetical protein